MRHTRAHTQATGHNSEGSAHAHPGTGLGAELPTICVVFSSEIKISYPVPPMAEMQGTGRGRDGDALVEHSTIDKLYFSIDGDETYESISRIRSWIIS